MKLHLSLKVSILDLHTLCFVHTGWFHSWNHVILCYFFLLMMRMWSQRYKYYKSKNVWWKNEVNYRYFKCSEVKEKFDIFVNFRYVRVLNTLQKVTWWIWKQYYFAIMKGANLKICTMEMHRVGFSNIAKYCELIDMTRMTIVGV